jgi:hypothetical protein
MMSSTDLIELARFPTSAEASIVRSQLECEGIRAELGDEAAASWLWHLGTAIGGVRLLVMREDAERARTVIGAANAIDESYETGFDDDAGDDDLGGDNAELPEDLIRAWRASLIGLMLLPPLLNVYSTWLLVRNGLFVNRCRNWRVFAACTVNALAFAAAVGFALVIANPLVVATPPETPPQYFTEDGKPVKVEYSTKTQTIRLVPE